MSFTNRAGNALAHEDDDNNEDDDDDDTYSPNDDDSDDDDDEYSADADSHGEAGPDAPADHTFNENNDHVFIAGVDNTTTAEQDDDDDDDEDYDPNDDEPADADDDDIDETAYADDNDNEPAEADNNDDDEPGAEAPDDDNNEPRALAIEEAMEAKYGARSGQYGLRPRKPRDYSHVHTTLECTVMTQHSMKKGIKVFGEAGIEAVLQELKQLHDRKVLEPRSASDLSPSERKAALQYLMFLKQKRSGKIKGRGCADGRKQREHTTKEEASSPTVAIESVLLSCTIDAKEKRDVATVDIPGAFMQADMDEIVHLKMQGQMAELLVKLDPKMYRKHVQTEGGKTVLYVELRKALYGTLRAALLFWRMLTNKLKEWGFVINPYDWCVANKTVNGKQCTILWHVDDLKILHVDPQVVTDVISQLSDEFGKEAPLTVTRGAVHDYLGMTLDYSISKKIKITMIDYIKNMLTELPPDMDGESPTPAANHLFEVNEAPTLLDEQKSQFFHHNVAKLLFLCKRARPDIQTAVAFLCTRVKASDEDDYKKLARVMKYLRGTVDMPLTLETDDIHVVKWWVDASYAVHQDMKSHTGGTMSLGKGGIYSTSTRQKLVTKSSTEAELVGVSDVMPQILWTRYFLEAQGYDVNESIVYQDNQSAMLLEKNGRGSSSKRTRHINIRYFFVQDRVEGKEIKIEYCPTGNMIADFFTKPLQGTLFKKFRDLIMNCSGDHTPQDGYDPRSVLGNDGNDKVNQDGDHCEQDDLGNPKVSTGQEDSGPWITVSHKKNVRWVEVASKVDTVEDGRSKRT